MSEQTEEQQAFPPEGRRQFIPAERGDFTTSRPRRDNAALAIAYIRSHHFPGIATGPAYADHAGDEDGTAHVDYPEGGDVGE
ncbi:hypothetical protein ABZ953_06870 [Streptomyces sp. NPDC046465]|uniref:hypothetical protein n=1 Tax=Streptomyces sp. NPDC046465 TaxID=3155810 RepID=UPI0034005DC4